MKVLRAAAGRLAARQMTRLTGVALLRQIGAARLVLGVGGILFSEALAAEGAVVFAKSCELGLEGVVSKRAGSLYKSGPSRNWVKAKNPDFVRT